MDIFNRDLGFGFGLGWWKIPRNLGKLLGILSRQTSPGNSELGINILYSDIDAFIRLPQLHIAGLLYSGLEPPISFKLLLPKLQFNLGSLMVSLDPSLDQGHNEIVLHSMVHVCPFKF